MTSHVNGIPQICFRAGNFGLLLMLSFTAISCAHKSNTSSTPPPVVKISTRAININKADVKQLAILPGVGPNTAKEIIDFRNTFGKFRRAEHLMLVSGISDKRFRRLRSMVKTE